MRSARSSARATRPSTLSRHRSAPLDAILPGLGAGGSGGDVLVAGGATNREIGERLHMAEKTASVHVSRILAKLDARSCTEAAAVAHRQRLVSAA